MKLVNLFTITDRAHDLLVLEAPSRDTIFGAAPIFSHAEIQISDVSDKSSMKS